MCLKSIRKRYFYSLFWSDKLSLIPVNSVYTYIYMCVYAMEGLHAAVLKSK